MKKESAINLTNNLLMLGIIIADIVLGFIFDFKTKFMYSVAISVIALALLNLVVILIKEINKIETKKLSPIVYLVHLILGCLIFYILKYVGRYNDFGYLYWLGLILGMSLPYIILNKMEKKINSKSNNGPKFRINR